MAWGDRKKAKAAAESKKQHENLKKAASEWNKLTPAQKKAKRRWGHQQK